MRRASPRQVQPVVREIVRLCARSLCGQLLTKSQRKFCSHACRNMALLPGQKGGAPEKYRPEYATTKLEAYLKACEQGHVPTLYPTASSYIVLQNANLPSFEGYAEYIGVSDETLRNWTLQHPEFARAMDRLKRVQRNFLINNGLSGRYNANIAKLMLGVNHGMIERKEVDSTHRMIGLVRLVYERADELEREAQSKKAGVEEV